MSRKRSTSAEPATAPARRSTPIKAGARRASFGTLRRQVAAGAFPIAYEEPDFSDSRLRAWISYYDPQSPAALHYMERCVHASLLMDRTRIAHDLIVSNQVRKAPELWKRARREEVAKLVEEFAMNSREAARRLRDTAEGCHWMLHRWNELRADFERVGWWSQAQLQDVVRLLGHDGRPDRIRLQPGVWRFWLFNTLLTGDRGVDALESLQQPSTMPEEMLTDYGLYGENRNYPDDAAIRGEFDRILTHEIATLTAEAQRLWNQVDQPDLAEATGRALVIEDPKQANTILRFLSEARNNFDKAYTSLIKALTLDDALNQADLELEAETEEPIEPSSDAPNEADGNLGKPDLPPPPPATPVETDSQRTNEANPPMKTLPTQNEADGNLGKPVPQPPPTWQVFRDGGQATRV
ncbi:MAG: hypothetical protein U0794_01640 [Isosphaeraceae bacterium]